MFARCQLYSLCHSRLACSHLSGHIHSLQRSWVMLVRPLYTVGYTRNARVSHSRQWSDCNIISICLSDCLSLSVCLFRRFFVSPETCRLQAGMFRLLVFVRPRTSVLGWRHTLGFRRSKTSTPLVHRQIVCCSMDAQHIWRQKLCCRRATSLEQPPSTLARRRHQL